MNRGHTASDYLRLVERLRTARPDLAFSTDIICGHPGEREEDHAATLALIREVGFAQAFSFKYSSRPGTPAAGAPLHVEEAVKDRRLAEVQALLREQQASFNAAGTGHVVDVLFTGPGRREGQVSGRTPWLQPVHALGPCTVVGSVAPVRIVAGNPSSLVGELVHPSPPQGEDAHLEMNAA
jgi:tRNA-2-methylthio-N6-dimethylallyladenosine synthase